MGRVFTRLSLVLGLSLAFGCNALTEPNKFDVVKEKREEAAATPTDTVEVQTRAAGAQPGAATQPNGPAGPRPGKTAIPVEQLKAQAAKLQQARGQAPQPANNSCGE